ncbi:GNAT family N-acetyltransferase [Bacillus sp. FJAT-50079]|uniref:GNAT family N-acetyltransferase n=1 Tax=Bacillus sp. FJAT-50079 TaxID=2833577 RepID=UPI001BC93393|nr:GNAT family N-acetyltransferase [Bacillus sp. FJAT-50079]MBS4207908.1 GNAT family N-acetyltransferase [Bacillus sp. FJAT-50079]
MRYLKWNYNRLKELVDLWNRELGASFPMRKELFEQNSFQDTNICHQCSQMVVDPDRNEVIGFVIVKKWQDAIDVGIGKKTGWIQAMLVDQKYRNRGIGTTLLEHAEASLIESGVNRILLGKDTSHYFPGIPSEFTYAAKWFEKRGYVKSGEEYDLDCFYEIDRQVVIPAKEGVEVSLLDRNEKQLFITFLNRSFPGRWEYEAIKYFEHGGDGREFVILKKKGRIIGFCRINDSYSPVIAQNTYWAPLYEEAVGGIGPLGIDANERQYGYGLFIVQAAVAYLRKRNIQRIIIDWTGLVSFYNKLGYQVCKRYDSYQKHVECKGE